MDEDEKVKEDQDILRWWALTQHEFWGPCVKSLATAKLAEATTICCNPGLTEEARRVAMGAVSAWSDIMQLDANSARAYDEMREPNEAQEVATEDVGVKVSEQWYTLYHES